MTWPASGDGEVFISTLLPARIARCIKRGCWYNYKLDTAALSSTLSFKQLQANQVWTRSGGHAVRRLMFYPGGVKNGNSQNAVRARAIGRELHRHRGNCGPV